MVFRILLALLFSILAAAGVCMAIFFKQKSYKAYTKMNQMQEYADRQHNSGYDESQAGLYIQEANKYKKTGDFLSKLGFIGIVIGIVGILAFVIVPWNFYTVNPGEAVVVKHLGEAKEIKSSGTYANFWMTDSIERYDTKVRNIDITTMTYSNDAQTMDIEMTIQYSINGEHLIDIVNKYGDVAMLESKIKSVAIEKTKAILSSYKAMEIIARRSEMSPIVSNAIKDTITSDYYVTISTVVLTNIDFTDAFEKAVEEKMIAEQKKLQADYENETTVAKAQAEATAKIKVAEAEIQVAEAKAQVLLIEAEADKNAKAEQAKATAIKLKYNAVEIAKSLGLGVTENFDEEGNLDSYTIDYSSDTDNTKAKLISNYLEYVIYLETWDGQLPQTYVADGTATIMVTP